MLNKAPLSRIPAGVLRLARTKKTPFLAINKRIVEGKLDQFRKAMPGYRIFYAVKANDHQRVVKVLQTAGSDFEVASKEELELLLKCGATPQQMISSNPIKSEDFIRAAHAAGVRDFAFDSQAEIGKLARNAPGSRAYVRLAVSNEGSQWPLSRKFGVEADAAVDLLAEAARSDVIPYGITFHVGSQCTSEVSWTNAITASKRVWEDAARRGIRLHMLNIGGGFPISYSDGAIVPTIDHISGVISTALRKNFPEHIEVWVEPGRALVGDAGILVTTVIAKANRAGQDWLYLDAGVFNGLMEAIGGFRYPMVTHREGPRRKWVVAGPSCDGFDVISNETELPEMEIGDTVYLLSAGAYTTVYASRFNGFPIPSTYLF